MLDPIVKDSLEIIDQSLENIVNRSKEIVSSGDFTNSEQGLILLDSIAMRLQVIGEKVKKIESVSPGIFQKFGIDAQPIIRFRDFISHHYENADHEVIFDICQNNIPELRNKVRLMLKEEGGQHLLFS